MQVAATTHLTQNVLPLARLAKQVQQRLAAELDEVLDSANYSRTTACSFCFNWATSFSWAALTSASVSVRSAWR